MLDNYPPGAANDPNAPYNQDPGQEYTRTVSLTVSFDFTTEGPSGADDDTVAEWIDDEVRDILKHSKLKEVSEDFGIDELEVIDE